MKKFFFTSTLILLPLSAFGSTVVTVPEPGTLGLLALAFGVAALVSRGRRK